MSNIAIFASGSGSNAENIASFFPAMQMYQFAAFFATNRMLL
jgi:formyltetrahydrofolate-dependent phosphoribosylglycinamide formyltransferase (EC 2.1.2.2)